MYSGFVELTLGKVPKAGTGLIASCAGFQCSHGLGHICWKLDLSYFSDLQMVYIIVHMTFLLCHKKLALIN